VTSDREPGTDGKKGSTGGPGAGKIFKPETPEQKAEKEGAKCRYCGVETTNEAGHPNSRERDHIDPKSRGGNNSSENEGQSCRTCNRSKGARNPDEWEPKQREQL
jgi:5-methylcytosine-specific restriction endonuclease McrA